MTCLPWTPLATGAVKRNVSSELVVGSDGLSASEPRRGAIGAEGAVELVLRVAEPGAVAPDRFEPAPRPARGAAPRAAVAGAGAAGACGCGLGAALGGPAPSSTCGCLYVLLRVLF